MKIRNKKLIKEGLMVYKNNELNTKGVITHTDKKNMLIFWSDIGLTQYSLACLKDLNLCIYEKNAS